MTSTPLEVGQLADRLLACMADGLSVLDADGYHILVNDEFCRITGYSREELLGARPPHAYWPSEELDKILPAFQATLEGQSKTWDLTFMRRDGTRIPVRVHPSRWQEGDTVRYLATVQDLSEQRRHASQLAKAEQLLDTMMAHGDFAWWEWDLPADRITASDSFFKMLGDAPDAWEGTRAEWRRRIHPDDAEAAEQKLELLRRDRTRIFDAEFRMRHARDDWRWILARGYITERDAGGRPTRISGTHQDIQQLKGQELQLRQAQKIEALGQLTGGIAHDLNNILGVAYGQIDELRAGFPPVRGAELDRLFATLQRAADLTHALLSFARTDRNPPEHIDVRQFMARLPQLIQHATPDVDSLRIEAPVDHCAIYADPRRLENALLNLVLNALDALQGSEGRIHVSARLDPGWNQPAPGRGAQDVVFAVVDDGAGMNAEVLARACDPLFTTRADGPNTGLGLSLVQQFATSSGGTFELRSAPGVGTTAEIRLPAVPLDAPLTDEALPPPTGDEAELPPRGKALVVDDESTLLELVARSMVRLGFEVERAESPAQALAVLRGQDIDILLTDVVMPHTLDGIELARRAKILRPEIQVVFMTGYAVEELEGRAARLGRVLHKPFTSAQLKAAVNGSRAAP